LGVPAGAVLTVPEALAHPQVADRGLVASFDGAPGVDGPVRVLRPGVKLDGAAPAVADPPPVLGADAAEVYGAIGLDEPALERLREEGVI
jgi:formyl-CoA transferase